MNTNVLLGFSLIWIAITVAVAVTLYNKEAMVTDEKILLANPISKLPPSDSNLEFKLFDKDEYITQKDYTEYRIYPTNGPNAIFYTFVISICIYIYVFVAVNIKESILRVGVIILLISIIVGVFMGIIYAESQGLHFLESDGNIRLNLEYNYSYMFYSFVVGLVLSLFIVGYFLAFKYNRKTFYSHSEQRS